MPAPVTHIVLALLVLPFLPNKEKRDFILGASFPDIRYYRVIDRASSHKKNPSWKNIEYEKSSFKAGMEFHALVDVMHDTYMKKSLVLDLLPKAWKTSANYLKFFEDILLYPSITDWAEIASYFDTILKEETDLVSDPAAVTLWHQTIKNYISNIPTPETIFTMLNVKIPKWYNFIIRIPVKVNASTLATTLAEHLQVALANSTLIDEINYFYDNFLLYLYPKDELKKLSYKLLLHG